jgi:hypothetical protein
VVIMKKNAIPVSVLLAALLLPVTATAAQRGGAKPDNIDVATAKGKAFSRLPRIASLQSDSGGEFLIDTCIFHSPAQEGADWPSIASDGTNCLAVWSAPEGILGIRVDSGMTIAEASRLISRSSEASSEPSVAFDSDHYNVVYQAVLPGGDAVVERRVLGDGTPIDSQDILVSRVGYGANSPCIARGSDNSLVVWTETRGGSQSVYASRLSHDGVVLDTQGILVSDTGASLYLPSVAAAGGTYLVAWEDSAYPNGRIRAARVSAEGVLLDSTPIVVQASAKLQNGPSVASDGRAFMVAWGGFSGQCSIFFRRFAPDGSALDSSEVFLAQTGSLPYYRPQAAFDGIDYVVCWGFYLIRDELGVSAARVDTAGMILDPDGFEVSPVQWSGPLPVVACGGSDFTIAWLAQPNQNLEPEQNNVYAARVTGTGVLRDSTPVLLSWTASLQDNPAIASDGHNYLIAWEEYRNIEEPFIYGAIVTPQGNVIGNGSLPICTDTGVQDAPAVAYGDGIYFVVWRGHGQESSWDVYGRRISSDGVLLDSAPIDITSYGAAQEWPSIAFDGHNFLVVWQDDYYYPNYHIYGARVTPAGVKLTSWPGLPVCTEGSAQNPRVAWVDTNYLVVWPGADVYSRRVNPDGTLPDTSPYPTVPGGGILPVIASNGSNCLVSWYAEDTAIHVQAALTDCAGHRTDSSVFELGHGSVPSVAFDSQNYFVAWQTGSNTQGHIRGARVSPNGVLIDTFPLTAGDSDQHAPAVAAGAEQQVAVAYSGWTGQAAGRTYNENRIWCKLGYFTGQEESKRLTAYGSRLTATVVRGVLYLSVASSPKLQATSYLLDIAGREVQQLHPGTNDVSRLAPGVYFVRERPSAAGRQPSAVWKVILTK